MHDYMNYWYILIIIMSHLPAVTPLTLLELYCASPFPQWHPNVVMTPLRPIVKFCALRTREQRPQHEALHAQPSVSYFSIMGCPALSDPHWVVKHCSSASKSIQETRHNLKNMNPNNTKKSPIHETADANITCDFGDGDISRLGIAYLTHVIHTYSSTCLGRPPPWAATCCVWTLCQCPDTFQR